LKEYYFLQLKHLFENLYNLFLNVILKNIK